MVPVLLACGLRRAEVAALSVQDLQQREEPGCSHISSARVVMSGPSQSRPGFQLHVEHGLRRRNSPMARSSARSTEPAGLQCRASVLKSSGAW